MRLVLGFLGLGGLVIALAACGGGGGGTDQVGDCKIEPNTICQNTDFSGEDLSGADLTGADLNGSTFRETNLSDANLTEADLSDAIIVDANLDDANLTRTSLRGATIEGTDLSGTTRCGTIRTNGTIDDTSCPASGGGGATTTTATTATTATTSTNGINPNLPEIVTFDGPSTAKCGQGTQQATVRLSWATRKATELAWSVDGQTIDGPTDLSGSAPFAFDCGSAQHAYTIRASNDKGQFATDTVTVAKAG